MNAPQPSLDPGSEAAASPDAETPPTPTPEPWTPERVVAWNAYYDIYVALGALLLGLLTSAVKAASSSLWTNLRAGQLILRQGPVLTDVFSYTAEGARWVDVSWLYQAANALLYGLGATMFSADAARADRVGVMAVVVANAVFRMLTLLTLLGFRRQGPGLWWTAVCASAAVAWISPATLGPQTWGLTLLSLELLLLFHAIEWQRKGAAIALIALFALWANLDASFLVGLILLALAAIGGGVTPTEPKAAGERSWAWSWNGTRAGGLVLLAACAGACLVNPAFVRVFPAAAETLLSGLDLPVIHPPLVLAHLPGVVTVLFPLLLAYVVLVAAGLFSFWVNRSRFATGRFAVFLGACVLFALSTQLRPAFAVVLAATLALNGQEWYLARFGTSGRLGKTWAFWSVGGRSLTIVLTFVAIALSLTGYAAEQGDPVFGFGYDPDDFALEAAEYLKTSPFRGQVLNANPALGDALIWKAYPTRKTFMDSRRGVFPAEVEAEYKEVREALRDGDKERWKPILDRHQITVVMLNRRPGAALGRPSPRTFDTLASSPEDWIPFYDDGNVVLFGRADAEPGDLAYFRSRRLDAAEMAYQRATPIRVSAENPSPTTWLDAYFKGRTQTTRSPHTWAAIQWLHPSTSENPDTPKVPDPAQCLLAIREARIGLARNKPDDTLAYRILAESYKYLLFHETPILARGRNNASVGPLAFRVQQRATALNFAIMTAPPPEGDEEREAQLALNRELFSLYQTLNHFDLARDRLAAIRALSRPGEFDPAEEKLLTRFDEAIAEVKRKMDEPPADGRSGPLARFDVAQRSGMTGLAIAELVDIEKQGVNPAQVKARLLDLLCLVGQPDEALKVLQQGDLNDPALETEPGMSLYRHARVYLLLGQYEPACTVLEQAVGRLRALQVQRSLDSFAVGSLQGNFKLTTVSVTELAKLVMTQSTWGAELGLIYLESGETKLAADAFTKALTIAPKLPARPLLAYYLTQMGQPVPSVSEDTPKTEVPAAGELPENPFAAERP